MNKEFESFNIRRSLLDRLRKHLIAVAVSEGRTKIHGDIRRTVEDCIERYLDESEKSDKTLKR